MPASPTTVDVYVDRLVSEAPPLTAAQRDAVIAAFARLSPPRKREAA